MAGGAAYLDRRLAALCLHHMRDERGLVQVVQDCPAVPQRECVVPRGLGAASGARKQVGDHAAHAAGRRLANHVRRPRHVLLRTSMRPAAQHSGTATPCFAESNQRAAEQALAREGRSDASSPAGAPGLPGRRGSARRARGTACRHTPRAPRQTPPGHAPAGSPPGASASAARSAAGSVCWSWACATQRSCSPQHS